MGLDDASLLAVESALGGEELFSTGLGGPGLQADLYIVDPAAMSGGVAGSAEAIESRCPGAALLFLLEAGVELPDFLYDRGYTAVLRKPFELFALEHKVRALLSARQSGAVRLVPAARASLDPQAPVQAQQQLAEASTGPSGPAPGLPSLAATVEFAAQGRSPALRATREFAVQGSPSSQLPGEWLRYPLIPLAAEKTARVALRSPAPVWISGECGCGRRSVAESLMLLASDSSERLRWRRGESFAAVRERLASAATRPGALLLVEEIETRPAGEQDQLSGLLASVQAGAKAVRVIVTSQGDARAHAAAGRLSSRLFHALSGLEIELPPLRQRRDAIIDLAESVSAAVCQGLGTATPAFDPGALDKLATYAWPGNLSEFRAVLTRSLAAWVAGGDTRAGIIHASDLLFAPRPRMQAAVAEEVAAPVAASETNRADDLGRRPGGVPGATVMAGSRDAQGQDRGRELETKTGDVGEVPAAFATPGQRSASPGVALSSEARRNDSTPGQAPASAALLERVLTRLAHDFRNPIQTLSTFAELSATDSGEGESGLAGLARDSSLVLSRHLDLLDGYARLADPRPKAVSLGDLLAAAVDGRGPGPGRGVEIRIDGGLDVESDPEHLRLLVELLVDEVEAEAVTGSVVQVELCPAEARAEIRIPCAESPLSSLDSLVAGSGAVGAGEEHGSWRLLLAQSLLERNCASLGASRDGQHLILELKFQAFRKEALHG